MVSPDDQLQQQQAGKVEKSANDCEDSYCKRVNEAAASVSSLLKPEKMKDLAVANSSSVANLPDNKDKQSSRTIYGINTQSYKNKVGYQITTTDKSVDDLLNQKRALTTEYNQTSPSKHNDSVKEMIDFPSSPNESVFNDVQGLFGKSGFSVPSPTFGRLLGYDSRMALSKLSLKNANSSFIDAALSSCGPSGSALISPTFSMSDISVVVPSYVVLSDSNSDDITTDVTDDEPPFDLDHSGSITSNNSNAHSDLPSDINNLERAESCDINPAAVKVSNDFGADTKDEISSQMAVDFLDCDRDSRQPIDCEDRSILEHSQSPSRLSVESTTDERLTAEEKSACSGTATDSTNNASESFCRFDCADDLVDPFDDSLNSLNEDSSQWQKVGGARNKQKRKQNRSQPTTKRQDHRHQQRNPPRTSSNSTKELDRPTNSRPPHYSTPRNLPNRILRAKAKQLQQQQTSSSAHKANSTSSRNKVSVPYSSNSKASDTTEVIWSKPIVQTRATVKDEVSASESNPGAAEISAVNHFQFEANDYQTVNSVQMNGAVTSSIQPSGQMSMNPGHVQYDQNAQRAMESSVAINNPAVAAIVPDASNAYVEQGISSMVLSSPPAVSGMKPNLEGEELMRSLKKQLEYYFSSENLKTDSYLRGLMDNEQWVPIRTIADFPLAKKMAAGDINLIVAASRESSLLEVDEQGGKVRPNQNLCAVILREIPDGVQEEEIAALFDGSSAKITSCNYAGNTNWYVLFQSEGDAQTAYRHLRENVREFHGKPILARVKTKLHHLNSYSAHTSMPATYPVTSDTSATTINAQLPQQGTTSVDFMPPQQFLLYTPPPFPAGSAPLGGQVPAAMPPFIPRIGPGAAAPANPAVSSAPAPVSAVTINPAQLGGFVVHQPWPTPNFYPTAVDGSLRPPFGHFLQPVQPAFKHAAIPQYPVQNTSSASKTPNTNTQRYVEYQEPNQKQGYIQTKTLTTTYNQQPTPIMSNGMPPSTQTQAYYVLSDQPQNPASDMIQYVPAEQPTAYAHMPPVAANAHPVHYLPAVTRTPFVTPNANDSNIVVTAMPAGLSRQHLHFRNSGKRAEPIAQQVIHSVYSAPDQNGAAIPNQRVPYSATTRSSNNSYQPEQSPRFLQKTQHGYPPLTYNGPAFPHRQLSREHSNEMKMSYSNKSNNSYPAHDQRGKSSPLPTPSEAYGDRGNAAGSDQHNQTRRHSYARRTVSGPANGHPVHNEQRSYQAALDRRNMRQPRRPRRSDEEVHHPIAYPMGNTPFQLESNSFPPLPGAEQSNASPTNQVSENRPAAADVVKGVDPAKAPVNHVSQTAPPPPVKKYSETSGSSYAARPAASQPRQQNHFSDGPRNREIKPASAVNTQLVADKSPPVVIRQPRHVPAGDREQDVVEKPSSLAHADEAPLNRVPSPISKQAAAAPPAAKEHKPESFSSGPEEPAKTDMPCKSETDEQSKENIEVHAQDAIKIDGKETVASDAKPTYADMLKMKRAAAAAAQLNGKEASDSGKSDSGEETRSNDDAKDFENTSEKNGSSKTKEDEDASPANFERRDRDMRRNEPRRGGWQPRHHQDRNDDYRRYPRRDWSYSNDRGYRGRGGGFRGRRPFRDNRFNNVSNARPTVANGQAPIDR